MSGFWSWFWRITFALSGVAFAVIAAVVAVRGVGDLRRMLEALRGGASEGPK